MGDEAHSFESNLNTTVDSEIAAVGVSGADGEISLGPTETDRARNMQAPNTTIRLRLAIRLTIWLYLKNPIRVGPGGRVAKRIETPTPPTARAQVSHSIPSSRPAQHNPLTALPLIPSTEYRVSNIEYRISNIEYRISNIEPQPSP